MNDSNGRRVILAAAVAMLAIGSASAEDEVIVNASRAAASSTDVGGLSAYRNPLAPPAADSAVAEPRSSVLASGVRAGTGAAGAPSTRAFGTFGIPFSSTRVSAGASTSGKSNPNFLATTFPYRAVGKLLFSQGYCTASVILRSVIVTAAHCIQNFGSGAAIFTNHRFIPAHYQPGKTEASRAPYGTWTWAALTRPASWADGTDTGSGAARDNDLAVIALAKDASGRFIGDVTGKLGYAWNNYSFTSSSRTGNLAVAAVTTLGYPARFDAGGRMQRTDGPAYLTTIGGAGQIWQGSNFTSGSSGGPWLVNFRSANPVLSAGAGQGTEPKMAVIGVTSWGSADPNGIKDNYSTQFRQNSRYAAASYGSFGGGNIGSLLNTLCKKTASGGQTYEQLGYCD